MLKPLILALALIPLPALAAPWRLEPATSVAVDGRLAPGRRPFHTIIPGMLLEGGRLLGAFGVMGGPMQPQGHMQVVCRLVDHGDDPQAALDAPRWRVDGGLDVQLEPGLWGSLDALAALGHRVRRADVVHDFGVGQAILRLGDALVGGSDGRGDGYAAAL